MELTVVNGRSQNLDPRHRALAYGDGVFETIRLTPGKIHFLDPHIARLTEGCSRLYLPFNERIKEAIAQILNHAITQIDSVHVGKIMLLRNSAGRGYGFDESEHWLDWVVSIQPYTAPSNESVRLLMEETPISENRDLAGIKHLNRLDSVMALHKARTKGYDDVILCTQNKRMIESAMANLFFKINNRWVTPKITDAGVNGIIRTAILNQTSEVIERDIYVDELPNVREAFTTNSLIGAKPVLEVNQQLMQSSAFVKYINESIISND